MDDVKYLAIQITDMKKKLLFAIAVVICGISQSQMTVTSSLTVQQYVQDVLLGNNVTVSNITFNGSSANVSNTAVGGFDCVDCNMSIGSGFLMATGDAAGAVGPNNQTSYSGAGTGVWDGTDPDLVTLVQANGGNSVNDWVIIEFDFVPLGDTLRFEYIWASEEYDYYANSGFNDVFGFLISGPGITGPYSNNAQNIALLPGTNISVGINTVNNSQGNNGPCVNCEYYNQDSDADGFPWPIDPDAVWYNDPHYMQYDGYTDVLTAMAVVQCGLTYHIKLAVCDANDSGYDSAVFLQRDSFSSNLVVQASLELDVAGPDGNTLFENCGDGHLVFARPISGNPQTELVAYLSYSGTATNGVDYTLLPDSVVFLPGQMTITLFVDGFIDGLVEGIETVHIQIENIADCGEGLLASSFDFVIADTAEPLVVTGYSEEICSGVTTTLIPNIEGGYAVYDYNWSTNETTPTIDVTPPMTTTYFLTVSDTCGMASDNAEFPITVIQTPILLVDVVDQDSILPMNCDAWGGSLYAIVQGGVTPYTYIWTDDQGNGLWGSENSVSINTWNAGMVYVAVHDQCGFSVSDSIVVTVNAPALSVNVNPVVNATCGQPFSVTATAIGGFVSWGYSYSWNLNGTPAWQWTDTYNATANGPAVLTVVVDDNCGQTATANVQVIVFGPAIDLELPDELNGNCATIFNVVPILSGGTGNPSTWNYQWTNAGNIIGNGTTLNSSFPSTTLIELNVADGCGQTATDQVNLVVTNPPLAIDLGEDINTSCVALTPLMANYSGGSGNIIYQWIVNGAVVGSGQNYNIQSFVTVDVNVNLQDACGSSASDQITINIPDIPLTILAAADSSICPGDSIGIWALATGGEEGFVYDWNSGSHFSGFTDYPALSYVYHVTATDICGRTIEESVAIGVLPITASFNTQHVDQNLYSFEATPIPACPGCEMLWDFGDGDYSNEPNPVHEFDGLDTYTVTYTVINEIGCRDEGSTTIIPPPIFYIPNSFSPNGDGINDVFFVVSNSVLEYEMHVFNRWGDEVFSSNDPNVPWIGDNQKNGEYYIPNGVYNYTVRIKGYNSETYKQAGSILIFR